MKKKFDPAALTVPVALLAIFSACLLAYVPLAQASPAACAPTCATTPAAAAR